MEMLRVILLAAVTLPLLGFAAPPIESPFGDPRVRTSYSELLQQKQAKIDSLLPALDGDRALDELLRTYPRIWSMKRLETMGELATSLEVELVYLDGVREEQYCTILPGSGAAGWKLRIGVDFTSGGSNTVAPHIAQCLQQSRDEMGYAIKKGEAIVQVPPRKVWDEIGESRISHAIDPGLQTRLLETHREVARTGDCPSDIRSYARLLDVWDEVKGMTMDLEAMDADLDPERNGGRKVQSCAFSREWNRKYSETAELQCRADDETCQYNLSETGKSAWRLDAGSNLLVFQRSSFLGIPWGRKSIREKGGTVLDLRLIQLSAVLYLEAYVDKDGTPASLGYVMVGKQELQ